MRTTLPIFTWEWWGSWCVQWIDLRFSGVFFPQYYLEGVRNLHFMNTFYIPKTIIPVALIPFSTTFWEGCYTVVNGWENWLREVKWLVQDHNSRVQIQIPPSDLTDLLPPSLPWCAGKEFLVPIIPAFSLLQSVELSLAQTRAHHPSHSLGGCLSWLDRWPQMTMWPSRN